MHRRHHSSWVLGLILGVADSMMATRDCCRSSASLKKQAETEKKKGGWRGRKWMGARQSKILMDNEWWMMKWWMMMTELDTFPKGFSKLTAPRPPPAAAPPSAVSSPSPVASAGAAMASMTSGSSVGSASRQVEKVGCLPPRCNRNKSINDDTSKRLLVASRRRSKSMWGVGSGAGMSMNPMKENVAMESYHKSKTTHWESFKNHDQALATNRLEQTNEQNFTHQNLKAFQSSSSPLMAPLPSPKKTGKNSLMIPPPNSIFSIFWHFLVQPSPSPSRCHWDLEALPPKFFSTFSTNSSESKKSSSSLISWRIGPQTNGNVKKIMFSEIGSNKFPFEKGTEVFFAK